MTTCLILHVDMAIMAVVAVCCGAGYLYGSRSEAVGLWRLAFVVCRFAFNGMGWEIKAKKAGDFFAVTLKSCTFATAMRQSGGCRCPMQGNPVWIRSCSCSCNPPQKAPVRITPLDTCSLTLNFSSRSWEFWLQETGKVGQAGESQKTCLFVV